MVVVFLAFLAAPDVFLKLLGIGLAAAIFLDATLVRMVLVPAVMQILGDRNWWIPDWLERILPRLEIEARRAPGGGRGLAHRRRPPRGGGPLCAGGVDGRHPTNHLRRRMRRRRARRRPGRADPSLRGRLPGDRRVRAPGRARCAAAVERRGGGGGGRAGGPVATGDRRHQADGGDRRAAPAREAGAADRLGRVGRPAHRRGDLRGNGQRPPRLLPGPARGAPDEHFHRPDRRVPLRVVAGALPVGARDHPGRRAMVTTRARDSRTAGPYRRSAPLRAQ